MKLNYKILWIDDQIETIISLGVKEEIQERLESLEFIVTIDCYETKQLAEEKLKKTQYDLILSDYNIGEGENKGNILIDWIRNEDIFTEVLFYSSQRDYEKTLTGTDRVSYFPLYNDEGYRGFKEKVFGLIQQTVYKFEELTPMRGLMMAETSILDSKVENILLQYFQLSDEVNDTDTPQMVAEKESLKKEKATLSENILKKIEDSILGNFRKNEGFNKNLVTLKLREKTLDEIVKSRIYDASKKARTIGDLIEIIGLKEKEDFSDFFNCYNQDVIETRNKLAHCKSEVIDDVEWLILGEDESEKYGSEECKEIRKRLKKYSKCLNEIHKVIST